MTGKDRYKELLNIAKKRGYNITEVAKKIGLSHNSLKKGIENDIIQLKYIKKLISLLDIDHNFFFEGKGDYVLSEPDIKYQNKNMLNELSEQLKFMRKMLEKYQKDKPQ